MVFDCNSFFGRGRSLQIDNSNVILIYVGPSGPPLDVTLNDTDPAMLSVTYRPPIMILRNGHVIGYVIRYTRVGSGISRVVNVNSDNANGLHTSVISGLVAFTSYSVEVAAYNVNGTGPFSDVVYGVTGQDGKNCTIVRNN